MHRLHAHLGIQRREKNNEAINECCDRVTLRTNEMRTSQQTAVLHRGSRCRSLAARISISHFRSLVYTQLTGRQIELLCVSVVARPFIFLTVASPLRQWPPRP